MKTPARAALAAALSASLLAPAAPALAGTSACPDSIPSAGYADVEARSTHAEGIDCVTWWEITSGSGFGTYQPSVEVRRDQMATFIARLVEAIGGDLPTYGSSSFDDVSYDNPHENNISRLADVGLINGTGFGTYSPSVVVNRAQMATFLVRAAEYARNQALPMGTDAFDDDNGNPHEGNINKAAAAGLASGVGPRQYRPAGSVRRDQMATFISRALNRSVELGDASVPVESIRFESSGDGLSDRFRLRSGAEYRVTYDFTDADCYYGAFLEPEDDDEPGHSLADGTGPASGTETVTDVRALDYRLDMITSEGCGWTLALERIR